MQGRVQGRALKHVEQCFDLLARVAHLCVGQGVGRHDGGWVNHDQVLEQGLGLFNDRALARIGLDQVIQCLYSLIR